MEASVVAVPRFKNTGSVVVAHGLSCSSACGIFPDQRSNPCLLHWQVDSLPLSHQGSPEYIYMYFSLSLSLSLCIYIYMQQRKMVG